MDSDNILFSDVIRRSGLDDNNGGSLVVFCNFHRLEISGEISKLLKVECAWKRGVVLSLESDHHLIKIKIITPKSFPFALLRSLFLCN